MVQSSRTRIEFEGHPTEFVMVAVRFSVRLGRSLQWPVYHPWSCYWLVWVETRHLVASIFQMGAFAKVWRPMGNSTSEFALRCFPTSFQVGIHVLWEPGHFCCLHQLLNCGSSISGYTGDQKKLQKVLEFWDGESFIGYHYYIISWKVTLNIFNVLFRCTSSYPWHSACQKNLGQGAPYRGAVRCQWITRDQCAMVRGLSWGRWMHVDQDDGFEFHKTLQTSWVKLSVTGIFVMWLPPKVFFVQEKDNLVGWTIQNCAT